MRHSPKPAVRFNGRRQGTETASLSGGPGPYARSFTVAAVPKPGPAAAGPGDYWATMTDAARLAIVDSSPTW